MSHMLGWGVAAVVVAAGIAAPFWWIIGSSSPAEPEAAPEPPKTTEFATGTGGARGADEVKFDESHALKYLRELCDLGPRISGSESMKKQQQLIEKHFKDLGATVTRQEFKGKQHSRKEAVEMVNLIISWNPEKTRRVLLCSHYDTRPIADQEQNRNNWNKPFVSANDGASGVALFMELGNHMKDVKCEFGVDFVLFDGEEYVFETSQTGGGDKYFFGSEYFAEQYAKSKGTRKYEYSAGLLFDLFAAKGAALRVEDNSYTFAKPLVEQVWAIAREAGAKSFRWEPGHEVLDDHIALNKAGIPTIDIIDFDYPHWHKLSDTVDKISGAQLSEVAKVVTIWLQKIK